MPINRRARARLQGFTLVELLVVVGIVALLIAIAVPAVGNLRQTARMFGCQGRLGAIASALATYSTEARGWLPPGPIEQGVWAGNPDSGTINEIYDPARMTAPSLSSQQGWYGMGLVWKRGYLHDGLLFYCPETDDKDMGYKKKWPEQFDGARNPLNSPGNIWVRYSYRGGMASHANTENGPLNALRHSGKLAVVADSPIYGVMHHEGEGYNVATLDGAVNLHPADKPIITSGRLIDFWKAIDAWWQP